MENRIKLLLGRLFYVVLALILFAGYLTYMPRVRAHAQGLIHLSGQVTDQNNQPINSVTVGLSSPGSPYIDPTYPNNDPNIPNDSLTGADGNYSLYAPAGNYSVVFIARIASSVLPKVETVNLQNDTVLNEQLNSGSLPTSTISGRITDSNGSPISGLAIYAAYSSDVGSGPRTSTDTDGNYNLSLYPDYYSLFLGDQCGQGCGHFLITPDNQYAVVGMDITQNLVLPDYNRTLAVTVRDSSGNTVAGQNVHASVGSFGNQRTFSNGGDFSRYVVSGENENVTTNTNGVANIHVFDNTTAFKGWVSTVYPRGDQAQNALDLISLDTDQSYTLWDDITPPSIGSFQWSSNPLALNHSTTLTVTVTDNLSGVAAVYYSNPTQGTQQMNLLNGEYTATFGSAITSQGNYEIAVWAYDAMGNQSKVYGNLNVYNPTPVLGATSWTNNPVSTTQSTTVTIPVSNVPDGIYRAEYYLGTTDPGQGAGAPMSVNGGNISATFANMTAGIYSVNFRAEDTFGNWSNVVKDYLVVFNPSVGGMSGHSNTITPTYGSDVLPGLIQQGQSDQASFALSAKYDNNGNITSSSKLKFSYSTGAHCNNLSQATNCHSLTLSSNSIQWLVINGSNNSQGTIQGTASLTIDGVTTTNPFRLTGVDGALLNPQASDSINIQIFAPGDDPNNASPIYYLNDSINKGSVKIT